MSKMISLAKLTVRESKCRATIDGDTSEAFKILTGVKHGCHQYYLI